MLGLIMNGMVEFVRYKKGTDGVQELEKIYGKKPNFKELKAYPDQEFAEFVKAVMSVIECDDVELFQKRFAPVVLEYLIKKYPDIPKKYPDLYSFLKGLPDIHYSIPAVFVGPENKKIALADYDDGEKRVKLEYRSPNKLDTLFEELIRASAKYYKEPVEIKTISTMSSGADSTVVDVKVLSSYFA
ncbi:MAG: hypothetical protein GXO25_08310 [Euryarchaeota archaeon]|nr:hypothetical protein [Euryarchaeota archaeon]